MDYTVFYKTRLDPQDLEMGEEYDFFFSGYDACERTERIFASIPSKDKRWIVFPHYQLEVEGELFYQSPHFKEDEFFADLFDVDQVAANSHVCVDITGFIRPHLIFLIRLLQRIGLQKIDFLFLED